MAEVFKNKWNTPEFRDIGEGNCILRTQVGSGAHGTNIVGTDDRDEMGVCIEPPEYVVGLKTFEQWVYRTQPEGHRSGAGDLDLTIYSLRKFMRLALQGNPTVLIPFFVEGDNVVSCTFEGMELRNHVDRIVSREAGFRFRGYLKAQKERMLGMKPNPRRTNRPELIEKYGYDTKFAGHAVSLGYQGLELLSSGRITLPMREEEREHVLAIRNGKYSLDSVITSINFLDHQLENWMMLTELPEHPDRRWANRFLDRTYRTYWAQNGSWIGA